MSAILNLFTLRRRVNRLLLAGLGALFFLSCGALLAFVLSPKQVLEARRIERLPVLKAEGVAAAVAGDELLVTGRLEDNAIAAPDGFVAYLRQTWRVTVPTPSSSTGDRSGKPTGSWKTVERVVPELSLNVDGRAVPILRSDGAGMSGPLHERLAPAFSWRQAEYEGRMLAEGSERVRGFRNGDLVTVLGNKASTGGVIPEEMFMGDRVAFVEHAKSAARGLFVFGLCMLAIAPIVLVGGILSALFGRRR
jgi:hypothetical protein